MKATVYRYNARTRNDRGFNNTGMEKNPNTIIYYATNLEYAENYRYIYTEDGDINYECELETATIDTSNLFDMANNFENLNTFNEYINSEIGIQLRDYTRFMNEAKEESDRKMWAKQIEGLKNRKAELINILFRNEFQTLSDFDRQNELVTELKGMGFNGYFTENEIAIF